MIGPKFAAHAEELGDAADLVKAQMRSCVLLAALSTAGSLSLTLFAGRTNTAIRCQSPAMITEAEYRRSMAEKAGAVTLARSAEASKKPAPAAPTAAVPVPMPEVASKASPPKKNSPARLFEKLVSPYYIPPAVAKQRPDLVEQREAKAGRKSGAAQKQVKGEAVPVAKPVASSSKAAPSRSAETPAQVFERLAAPIFIPPAVAKQRPDLVEKYQRK